MNDLLRETEESMKQERLQELWTRHGSMIISIIAGIILATAAWSGYTTWNHAQNVKSTNAMLELIEAEDFPGNIADADLDMRSGVKALTLLNTAGAHLQNEDHEKALSIYDQILNDKNIPLNLRDLALLSKTRIQSNQDDPDLKALAANLNIVVNNKNSAYAPQALIDQAVLHAAYGNYDAAIANLEIIEETPALPETLYMKAQTLGHVYEAKAAKEQKSPDTDKDGS